MASFRTRKRRGVLIKVNNQSGDVYSFLKDVWIKGVQYVWPTSAAAGFLKSTAAAELSFAGVLETELPSVTRLLESGGPTTLTLMGIADGKFFKRSGVTIIGADVPDTFLNQAQTLARSLFR